MVQSRKLVEDVLSTYDSYVHLDDWSKLGGIDDFLYKVQKLGYTGSTHQLKTGNLHDNSRAELSDIYSYIKELQEKGFNEGVISNMKSTIFISHSSKDSEIAKIMKEFIHAIGREHKLNVFCSSDGTSISSDGGFNEIILDNLLESKLAISILSKNYVRSEYCLMELGYFHFTSDDDVKLTSFTIDDFKDTVAVLVPIKTKQTKYFQKNDRDSISIYLDHLRTLLIKEFDLKIVDNPSEVTNKYVDTIIKAL